MLLCHIFFQLCKFTLYIDFNESFKELGTYLLFDRWYAAGADPGFFPRGGPVGHGHIVTETPQASQGKVRRGVWASPKTILNMKCSRSDSEQT